MTDSTPHKKERPLSPHLQEYRLPLLAITSILHRITGVGNSIGLIILTAFIYGLANDPALYNCIAEFFSTTFGLLVLTGFAASLAYHMCCGVRHLVYDTGRMMTLKEAYVASYTILGMTAFITAILAYFIWTRG